MLFQRFLQTCVTSRDMLNRLKCVGIVQNQIEESWLELYNGKPILLTECSSAREGINKNGIKYLEIVVNVHSWAFIMKKTITTMLPLLKKQIIDVGLIIEALDEDEVPECILGSVTLGYIDIFNL